jgi:hypothetical protein
MDVRPTKVDERQVGRTPWSARVPLDPLFGVRPHFQPADEGVGCGPGGPPHSVLVCCDYRSPASVSAYHSCGSVHVCSILKPASSNNAPRVFWVNL